MKSFAILAVSVTAVRIGKPATHMPPPTATSDPFAGAEAGYVPPPGTFAAGPDGPAAGP